MKRDLTQLVECVRAAMADAGVTEVTFYMDCEAPVTREQADLYLRFRRQALQMGLAFDTEEGPDGLSASATITNGRA
ncbi:MAG: hypothetical protein EKK62_17010 [Acidimicrobiia bacterium]|nr:MAG: hypothetical protein EKK62_17010 [Acidimicrobiia bacterium]